MAGQGQAGLGTVRRGLIFTRFQRIVPKRREVTMAETSVETSVKTSVETSVETSVVIFEKASLMLAEADTIQKVKEFKTLALTAADLARRKGMGEKAI